MSTTQQTQVEVQVRGVRLRRRTETGPRGGKRHIYQPIADDATWGYWHQSAAQAIAHVGRLNRMIDSSIR